MLKLKYRIMLRTSFNNVARLTPRRFAQTHAISKASIIDLQNRWDGMVTSEQQDIVAKLSERQKLPWSQMNETEQKAAWYISYGEWGPRRPVLNKGDSTFIAKGVIVGLVVSVAMFVAVRQMAQDDPKTMTKEWQLKSDEYLKSVNANPWTSYSQVQSK